MTKQNISTGWISLYRSIFKHWIAPTNREFTDFEAWIYIILEVNHSEQKVKLGKSLFTCKTGESLNSLDTWARLFKWNKSKVRRFFKLLESDNMIKLKNVKKTTQLTVCNYEDYQAKRNDNESIMKRKRNDNETIATPNNNGNNENNDNKEIIEYIYSLYPSKCPFKNKSLGKCSKDKTKIKSLLKTHTPKEIENKIQFYIKDCNSSNTWYKNFGTLLNNLPEIIEEPIYTKENPKEYVYTPANPVL